MDRIAGRDVPVKIKIPYRERNHQEMYALNRVEHGQNTVRSLHSFLGLVLTTASSLDALNHHCGIVPSWRWWMGPILQLMV